VKCNKLRLTHFIIRLD